MILHIFLSGVCLALTGSCSPAFSLPIRNINFSRCTLTGPQNIGGNLIAHDAQLHSLTLDGSADLANTTIVDSLKITGDLSGATCQLNNVYIEGTSTLHNTTVTGPIETLGRLACAECILAGPVTCSGTLELKSTTITGETINTGHITQTSNSTFSAMTLSGGLKGKNISCDTISVTGPTSLNQGTVHKTASFTGTTKCIDCSFDTITITGKTRLVSSSATDATIIGNGEIENCKIESLSVTGEMITLTNNAIATVYVHPCVNNRHPVININGPQEQTSKKIIKKIVCHDPQTQIIYGKDAIQARDIIGTKQIKITQ